jgi:hypothetical protein
MPGIYKSTSQPGVYFVLSTFWGIHIHASGTLQECRAYCRKNGMSGKLRGEW